MIRQLEHTIAFLQYAVILLLLTNAFTLAVALAAMWLRDGERLRARWLGARGTQPQ